MLVGPGSIILLSFVSLPKMDALVLVALTFGGTVALMILAFGRHSGSVINPAVTVAVATARLLKRGLIIPYLFFQTMGGIIAGLTLRLLFVSTMDTTLLDSTQPGVRDNTCHRRGI